ncbi:MAG TPA: PqqD family peptide modification chaperone, partial [Kofleriaceae bacterium]|nr:PqqD family peptide modification chaperone [Kofleriaceae bacterium]
MPLRLPKVRGDLQYFEQELEGEDVVVVRDPVRGTYFKYNLLQAAMLRALDGVRSLDDMIAGLAAEYEVDIPRAAAERFVAHARKMLLLDVASYAVPGARPAAKVMAALRRRGLRFEGPPPSPDGAMAATTALFTAAIRQLHLGRPAAALDYLTALLELEPDNARARELADAIQTAYLHAQSGRTSDFPTFLKLNPTPILRWLDRTIGKIAFHWIGGVLLAALVVLAVACYSITPFPETQLDAFDIALAIAVNTAYSFLHELGHALACYHYGGDVPEIGLTLFYYIRPLPYCDTSSSYLFTDRRHKLAVQLGGTVASMIVLCSIFVILAIVHPTIFFYQAMLVNLWVAVVMMFLNLVPFLKFDGYYALGDYAGVPNLRERSFKLLAAWLGARVLGLETREEPLSPGKRALFFGFAVVSLAFTAIWMYWAMFQLLAPVVEHFRGPGLIAAVLGLAYLVRGALLVPLGRLIAAVVRARRRVFTWRRSLVLAALAGAAATPWLIDGPVRVDADFVLVPRARADIRAEAAGWIDRVLVAEGDRVAAGQPVAILRDPELDRRLRGLELERAALDAELAALRQGTRPEALAL